MKTVTFVINLPERTDRRAEVEEQLARFGWTATFFPAVRPTSLDGFPSLGSRGCFLSHLGVLREARRLNAERLIILEDDLNFSLDFGQEWPWFDQAISQQKWSIAYPAHSLAGDNKKIEQLAADMPVRCSHFMMFHGDALDKIINGLEMILARPPGHPLGGPMHVDGAYTTLRSQDADLITLAAFPSLGYQRSSRSDIADVKWFDRLPAMASLVGFARRLMNRHVR